MFIKRKIDTKKENLHFFPVKKSDLEKKNGQNCSGKFDPDDDHLRHES